MRRNNHNGHHNNIIVTLYILPHFTIMSFNLHTSKFMIEKKKELLNNRALFLVVNSSFEDAGI